MNGSQNIEDIKKKREDPDYQREKNKRLLDGYFKDVYSNPSHCIFELLQNAEDALGQSSSERKSATVQFVLSDDVLIFSHYGKPFNKKDVDSICDIEMSTKNDDDRGTIGKFGIGFKSVYNFTETTYTLSDRYHFKIITDYEKGHLEPELLTQKERQTLTNKTGQTIIKLPFNRKDKTAGESKSVIEKGFGNFDAQSILFLRHISCIKWQTEHENSGFFGREEEKLDNHVRRVTIRSSLQDKAESWLIFDRDVHDDKNAKTSLEIGFLCMDDGDDWKVTKTENDLKLSGYFPITQGTHLKFHVQGKFNTNKSRESILGNNQFNTYLIQETGELLIDALRWLKKTKSWIGACLSACQLMRHFLQATYTPLTNHHRVCLPLWQKGW